MNWTIVLAVYATVITIAFSISETVGQFSYFKANNVFQIIQNFIRLLRGYYPTEVICRECKQRLPQSP